MVRGSGAAPAGDMDWLIILILSTEMIVWFYKNFRCHTVDPMDFKLLLCQT